MNKVSDNDLILLYYGESDDPSLAVKVAESAVLTERFETICAELKMADALVPPEKDDDYGAEVWRKISPRLETAQQHNGKSWLSWFSALSTPSFSFAGVAAVALLTVVAFLLGRQNGPGQENLIQDPMIAGTEITSNLDPERLLTRSISSHLDQVSMMLTEFANLPETSGREAEQATDMLLTNRLYKQAAQARGDQKLAHFLGQLEPILLELAYEAQNGSTATRERMQKEVNDGLLFKVRVMNNQLGSL